MQKRDAARPCPAKASLKQRPRMTYEVIVLPKAKRQIRKIDAWWRENRPRSTHSLHGRV